MVPPALVPVTEDLLGVLVVELCLVAAPPNELSSPTAAKPAKWPDEVVYAASMPQLVLAKVPKKQLPEFH